MADKGNLTWTQDNYVSQRALVQAENVRAQLVSLMERLGLPVVSETDSNSTKQYDNIRRALVCGYCTQVAHREGNRSGYLTVKDHQARCSLLRAQDILLNLSLRRLGCVLPSLLHPRSHPGMGPLQRVYPDDGAVHPHRDGGPPGMAPRASSGVFRPQRLSQGRGETVPRARAEESRGKLIRAQCTLVASGDS